MIFCKRYFTYKCFVWCIISRPGVVPLDMGMAIQAGYRLSLDNKLRLWEAMYENWKSDAGVKILRNRVSIKSEKQTTFKFHLLIPSLSSGSHEKALPSTLTLYSSRLFPSLHEPSHARTPFPRMKKEDLQNSEIYW